MNATESREPLSYKEVEELMKQQLRDAGLYEYPRGVSDINTSRKNIIINIEVD